MTKTTTSIDALIADGQYMFLIGNGPINILAGKLADALERQQAVVEAARSYVKGSLYDSIALCKALAALDAPPEGEKPKPVYTLGAALHRDWPEGEG